VADFFRQNLNFTGKNRLQQNRFLCHPLWDVGVTYTVQLWLVGKYAVDFLLVLIELFRQLSLLRRYERILVKIVVFEEGESDHFECKFQGEGVDHQRLLASEN